MEFESKMRKSRFDRSVAVLAGFWIAATISGCANVAPQASGGSAASAVPTASAPQDAQAASPAPAAPASGDRAAQPQSSQPQSSRYVVKRGDTLSSIAKSHGCMVNDLLAWNHLKRRARLVRGQSLRVAASDAAQSSTPAESAARQMREQTLRHAKRVALAWPAEGSIAEPFQPGRNRGIEIGGRAGDPVRAAADGRVMYAGTGLNEYGSLIIVQHNADFLTAYAHSRKLLVKTGDVVRQGDEIAEMGDLDNSRVALLFEVRRDGKPVDPMPYLPDGHG
jgi:lipoprotein NlpD